MILTDKEIDTALRTVSITIPHDEYRILQGRAVEKAVLQKLAEGINCLPLYTSTPGAREAMKLALSALNGLLHGEDMTGSDMATAISMGNAAIEALEREVR